MPYQTIDSSLAEPAPVVLDGMPLTEEGETLASMETELFYSIGGREDATLERLRRWINQAYIDLFTSLELDEGKASYTFLTTSGQNQYLVPDVVATTLGVTVLQSESIYGGIPLTKGDLSSYRRREEAVGLPREFFRYGKILVLWPTPSRVVDLSVDYRLRPAPLVEPTDSPILPREWHEAILLNARKKAFSSLMEFDKAMPAENDYVNQVRRRQDTEANETENRVPRSAVPRNGRMLIRSRIISSPEPE